MIGACLALDPRDRPTIVQLEDRIDWLLSPRTNLPILNAPVYDFAVVPGSFQRSNSEPQQSPRGLSGTDLTNRAPFAGTVEVFSNAPNAAMFPSPISGTLVQPEIQAMRRGRPGGHSKSASIQTGPNIHVDTDTKEAGDPFGDAFAGAFGSPNTPSSAARPTSGFNDSFNPNFQNQLI